MKSPPVETDPPTRLRAVGDRSMTGGLTTKDVSTLADLDNPEGRRIDGEMIEAAAIDGDR